MEMKPTPAHPIALPVVRAGVDEHAHATVEQPRDVVLRRVPELVERAVERGAYARIAAGEVTRRLHAEQLACRGLVQVVRDTLACRVAQRAVAFLAAGVSNIHRGAGNKLALVRSKGLRPAASNVSTTRRS
jgi:hypothetical protein